MPSSPSVTIIICARNAAAHLRHSVPAALAQDYPPHRFKVLVVDNGSSDETGRVAENLGAVVRRYAKPGVVGARQFGWKISRSELIAYLDADCEPPASWLRSLVEELQKEEENGATGGRLVSPSPQTLAERHIVEARILDSDRFWTRNALQWPFLATAGMVVRRKALEDVGGFDLHLGRNSGEDADLCWRLERAGWRVRYVPLVELIHHHRATIPAMVRQAHWYGRGSASIFARWRRELGWWRFTDWAPYRRFAAGVIRLPLCLLPREDRYQRWRPLLELLDAAAFLSGKWLQAAKERVLFL